MVELAKQAIDVGIMTNAWDDYRVAMESMGVGGHEFLKLGGGAHQHRFRCGEAILKINSLRAPVEPRPTTIRSVRVVAVTDGPQTFEASDDVRIEAVPAGYDGITTNEVDWQTPDPAVIVQFLIDAFGAVPSVDTDVWTIGSSRIRLVADADAPADHGSPREGSGIRYLTVQIFDVVAEHARVLALGATEGAAPVRMGETAAISFVVAPDGTWIELSQRASLTGSIAAAPVPDR